MGKVTFLGTGTSQGIPMIGCSCPVCQSADPRDKRLRSSALVEYNGVRILIDCGPDFRQQMLANNISDLDAVVLTHNHKDHTGGMDDIRSFNYFHQAPFPIYCEERVLESLQREYYYAFEEHPYPGAPAYDIHLIENKPFEIPSTDSSHIAQVVPVRVMHYKLPIFGYRFGKFGYITDGSSITDEELEKMKGVDILVVNTIRRTTHISHFSLYQALEVMEQVGAPMNFLTHLSHQIESHSQLSKWLSDEYANGRLSVKVAPAYDGLQVEF